MHYNNRWYNGKKKIREKKRNEDITKAEPLYMIYFYMKKF